MAEEPDRRTVNVFCTNRRGAELKSVPVLRAVTGAQYSGKGYSRCSQLHADTLKSSGCSKTLTNVLDTIRQLDDCSANLSFDTDVVLGVLKKLYTMLTNFEARRNHEESRSEEDSHTRFARCFIQYGGADVIMRLLMLCSLLPDETLYQQECAVTEVLHREGSISNLFKPANDTDKQLRVKSVALDCLSRLISVKTGDELSRKLAENDDYLSYLFTLLAHDKTFITACQFLEDLLQARNTVLNLNTISNIKALVLNLSDKKLANFCRVLAVTISDLDIYENKSSLYAQNKQKRTKGFVNVRDVNQDLLLGIQDLIPRLVQIAIARDYTPRYQGMASELDNWMEWIENSMSDDAFDPATIDELDNFIGGVSAMSSGNGPLVNQAGLRISTELILRVQVVYVLGLFLVGKHRKKVQRKLAELHLIPGLSELFEAFIWKCQSHRNNTRHRLRGHNASCECSPEVALKIQFLRLVHSFCDHSDYKHLLLSKVELNEVKRINKKAGDLMVDGLDDVNKSMMCRGSKGLLTKIVEVMKKEPTASTFRFWLARAVESYLRGNTSYCDQIFLLRRGLLQHIAGNILEHSIRPKEILQSSFDLMGELVKFNYDAFSTFDKVLNSEAKFDKFISTVNRSLVDSNMFIRALILSFEHFTSTQVAHKDYALFQGRLLQHVSRFELQMEYLQRLINLISVQNLTQENVSCLNTTLVFLMFANQKNQLPQYLQGLMRDWCTSTGAPRDMRSRDRTLSSCSKFQILQNFRDLLVFWQDHYLHKDKDCSALERSSRISFEFWKETVATLVSDCPDDPRAIVHYLDTDTDRPS